VKRSIRHAVLHATRGNVAKFPRCRNRIAVFKLNSGPTGSAGTNGPARLCIYVRKRPPFPQMKMGRRFLCQWHHREQNNPGRRKRRRRRRAFHIEDVYPLIDGGRPLSGEAGSSANGSDVLGGYLSRRPRCRGCSAGVGGREAATATGSGVPMTLHSNDRWGGILRPRRDRTLCLCDRGVGPTSFATWPARF